MVVITWQLRNLQICIFVLYSISVVVNDATIDAGGLRFDSRVSQIEQSRQRLATAATFFRSCIALALSHEDAPRRLLHASS